MMSGWLCSRRLRPPSGELMPFRPQPVHELLQLGVGPDLQDGLIFGNGLAHAAHAGEGIAG